MATAHTSTPERAWRGALRRLRHDLADGDGRWVALLSSVLVVCTVLIVTLPEEVPFTTLVLPIIAGSVLLGPRTLPWFVVACMMALVAAIPIQPVIGLRQVGAIVVMFLAGLIVLVTSFRRSRLGIAGLRGESMLVDLRDRLNAQRSTPPLPEEWFVHTELLPAGGTQFAGDFVVIRADRGDVLEACVVDVSGKGVGAGTRSLLLSGAFGSLLSAMTREQFLPAANGYLLRQDWVEGFATAIHLHLDLESGDFELRKAGHPPAVWLHAGSGDWSVLESDGPALGLIDDWGFDVVRGTLRPGDALVLYTDGLVEDPTRDISSGIDKLAGQAARMLRTGFSEQATADLVRRLGRSDDDRALLLVHRRWPGSRTAR